jgi:hypothetical protein
MQSWERMRARDHDPTSRPSGSLLQTPSRARSR